MYQQTLAVALSADSSHRVGKQQNIRKLVLVQIYNNINLKVFCGKSKGGCRLVVNEVRFKGLFISSAVFFLQTKSN